MRLIDAEELPVKTDWNKQYVLYTAIEEAPTIDAVPVVRGRWKGEGMGDYSCSLCSETVSGNRYRFCPNCGAHMK